MTRRTRVLKHERSTLLQYESLIDQQMQLIRQCASNSHADQCNTSFAYVTSEDLVDVFGTQKINLAVRDPSEHSDPIRVQQDGKSLKLASSAEKRLPLDVRLLSQPHGACFTRPIRRANVLRKQRRQTAVATDMLQSGATRRDDKSAILIWQQQQQQLEASLERITQADTVERDLLERQLNADLLLGNDLTKLSKFQPITPDQTPRSDAGIDSSAPFISLEPPEACEYSFTLTPSEGVLDLFELSDSSRPDDSASSKPVQQNSQRKGTQNCNQMT